MRSRLKTRVRSTEHGWQIDRRVVGLFWFPVGRWLHQDWWAPYEFATAQEALEKAASYGE